MSPHAFWSSSHNGSGRQSVDRATNLVGVESRAVALVTAPINHRGGKTCALSISCPSRP